MTKKTSEVRQLQEKLSSNETEQKQEAIRRIIDAMTRGKDVSMLFVDVIKNMETPSLQLKKLIYLYVMSYAKNHPDLAILGVSSFRKDAINKSNPFLRALAVRTMGCIRIKQITEYLVDPLKMALKDQDPYVRKTGALCVPKLYEIAPDMIDQQGFLTLLKHLLNDGNATVVSNAVAALAICAQIKGEPIFEMNQQLAQKLLTAMNDCNQWGVVYILDQLASYIPKDPQEAENIMERVSSRLAHTNSAVALSAIRLIVRFMDYLSNPEAVRTFNNKISSPLVTMISREPQVCYIVLKTMNLILQKRPLLLPSELKIFFVNYHDPLYVKLEKLEILVKIANNDNILLILHELKECVQEVDVQFVRKAVRTMGRCAIKLQKMADKCVQCLWETLKTKIPYVVQEAVIVIRDIFRKYPNKYEGLLADICENLKSLDDPEAKASIVWIIGEYVEMIENADELMSSFAENFKDEADIVQQQILISTMKLYLHRPSDGQQILKDLFKYVTKESQNPDLRDRGYLYWRLLSTNPKIAKEIVLAERPLISEQSYALDTEILDCMISNLTTLSSIYCKQPEEFVKKLKDHANARDVDEEDADQLLPDKGQGQMILNQEMDRPKQVSYANTNNVDLIDNIPTSNNNEGLVDISNSPSNIIDIEMAESNPNTYQQQKQNTFDDLLGSTDTNNNREINVKQYGTTIGHNANSHNVYSTQVPSNNNSDFDIMDMGNKKPQKHSKNIVIPLVEVLTTEQTSKQQKYSQLSIKAAFQRQGQKVFLQMVADNQSDEVYEDFALKLKANFFKLQPISIQIEDLQSLNPGETKEVLIELNDSNSLGELQGWPYVIDCAWKVCDDVFVFQVPCSLSIGFIPNYSLTLEQYKAIATSADNVKKQDVIPNKLEVESFVKKMQNNNMFLVFRKENGNNQLMSFGCQLMNQWKLVVQVIFDKEENSVNVQTTGPNEGILQYFNHALGMIINL